MKMKSAHSAYVCTAEHREANCPEYAGDVKPAPAYDASVGRVRPTTAREHDPLPLLDKMEKMPSRGVSKHKKMAAGRS